MCFAARKLLQMGIKVVKDSPDFGNPVNVDTAEFVVEVGKGILHVVKAVIF